MQIVNKRFDSWHRSYRQSTGTLNNKNGFTSLYGDTEKSSMINTFYNKKNITTDTSYTQSGYLKPSSSKAGSEFGYEFGLNDSNVDS